VKKMLGKYAILPVDLKSAPHPKQNKIRMNEKRQISIENFSPLLNLP
jgi:hypothetical protein